MVNNMCRLLEKAFEKVLPEKMNEYQKALFIHTFHQFNAGVLEKQKVQLDELLDYFEFYNAQCKKLDVHAIIKELRSVSIKVILNPRYFHEGEKEICGQFLDSYNHFHSRSERRLRNFGINILTDQNTIVGISFKAINGIELV
jgi:hypothetical protein